MLLQISKSWKRFFTKLAFVGATFEFSFLLSLLLDVPINIHFISLHFRCAVVWWWEADGCVRRVEFCKNTFITFFVSRKGFESSQIGAKIGKSISALQTQMIINYTAVMVIFITLHKFSSFQESFQHLLALSSLSKWCIAWHQSQFVGMIKYISRSDSFGKQHLRKFITLKTKLNLIGKGRWGWR